MRPYKTSGNFRDPKVRRCQTNTTKDHDDDTTQKTVSFKCPCNRMNCPCYSVFREDSSLKVYDTALKDRKVE